MHPILNIAVCAARKAGGLIAKCYETPDVIETDQEGANNFITNVDYEAKRLIVEVIRKFYPQHSIVSKGDGELAGEDIDVQWIIEPLNGTNNFIKRFPHFAVSIAVRIKGCTSIAVIYDPIRNEQFTASRGYGAQLNGYRIRGGRTRDLNRAILATGFPFKHKRHVNSYIALVSKLLVQCADFRCTGSSALDLAYVAAGRLDGFFEIGLNPWDFAGGELLVREASGLVTDFTGGYNYLSSGNIVAGNHRVIKAMLSIIRAEFSSPELENRY